MTVNCFKRKAGIVRASKNLLVAVIVALFIPVGAWALDLGEAKENGLVGERTNGYLAAVAGNPSPEVTELVNRINAARKDEYKRIAKKNGSPVSVVEKIAAQKAIEKMPTGQYVQRDNGVWVRK